MSDLKLTPGLVLIGDVLTETYTRKSRAEAEAKQAVGKEPDEDCNASIGISQVEEFIVRDLLNITNGSAVKVPDLPDDQAVYLDQILVGNPNQHTFKIALLSTTGIQIYAQDIYANQLARFMPKVMIRPGEDLYIQSSKATTNFRLSFKLCSLISV